MPNIKNQNEVKALVEKFKAMKGMILTEYHGLSVAEIGELRSKLKKQSCEFAVVKNRLSAIALKELGIETPKLSGPTAIVFENADTITPAKTVMDFAKDHAKLVVKAGYMDGKFVDAGIVKAISALPSKEVLICKMLGSMNAPISGFVNVLAANIRGLVNVLDAISKKAA